MSLPTAQKDVGDHPAKDSVVDPVNKANKDADIDRKVGSPKIPICPCHPQFRQIRFYGVIDAFRKGKLPSNPQIDETLRYVVDHSPVEIDKLSPEGRKLINDARDIITTARFIVQEKNADELFQQFVWHTRAVDANLLKPGDLTENVPVDSEKAKSDNDEGRLRLPPFPS